MEKLMIKIATFHYPPIVYLNQSENGKWQFQNGIDYQVIKALQEKINFRYELIIPKDKEWGAFKDGRWTGVIGMIHRNEADWGVCNLMQTFDRNRAVTFTVPYNDDSWLLATTTPNLIENTQAVIQPFQIEVWCLLFTSLFAVSSFLFFIQKVQQMISGGSAWNWRKTFWNMIAILCQENAMMFQLKGCALAFLVLWIFATSILQASYSGTLIGSLTFPKHEPKIRSFEDLTAAIQHRNYMFGVRKTSSVRSILEESSEEFHIINEVMNRDPENLVPNTFQGLIRVLHKRYVYLSNGLDVRFTAAMLGYQKFLFSRVLHEIQISIATTRDFQHLKEINKMLRRFSETGLVKKWKRDVIFKHETSAEQNIEEECEESSGPMHSLTISNLQGAFYLLLIGYGASCVILAIELMSVNKSRSFKRNPLFQGK